jgi:hypothetical protein
LQALSELLCAQAQVGIAQLVILSLQRVDPGEYRRILGYLAAVGIAVESGKEFLEQAGLLSPYYNKAMQRRLEALHGGRGWNKVIGASDLDLNSQRMLLALCSKISFEGLSQFYAPILQRL